MRIAATFGVFALLVSGFPFERRASLCGGGLLPASLPYGCQADWFNGQFRVTDG